MKDAEIQNFDSLTTDDLVLLIGEKEVWLRQKDKQIKALLKKVSDLKKLESLQNSIKTLSSKNIELDRALTEARKEKDEYKKSFLEIQEERDNLKKVIDEKDEELRKARNVISRLEELSSKKNKGKRRK